jgi:hypothetical protein
MIIVTLSWNSDTGAPPLVILADTMASARRAALEDIAAHLPNDESHGEINDIDRAWTGEHPVPVDLSDDDAVTAWLDAFKETTTDLWVDYYPAGRLAPQTGPGAEAFRDVRVTPESDPEQTYLNEVDAITTGFRFETCEICHLDLNMHTIHPDPLGHAHLTCLRPPADEVNEPGDVQQAGTRRVLVHMKWSEQVDYAEDVEIDVPIDFDGDVEDLIANDDEPFEGRADEGIPDGYRSKWLDRASFTGVEDVTDRDIHTVYEVPKDVTP